ILFRDVAYDGLPKSRRAELHERYADWLEHAGGERMLEYEELLGFHREQAYRYRSEVGRTDDAARVLGNQAAGQLASAGRRGAAERGWRSAGWTGAETRRVSRRRGTSPRAGVWRPRGGAKRRRRSSRPSSAPTAPAT